MALESMNLFLDIAQIPDANRLVRGGGRNQNLGGRVECQGIDSIAMAILGD